MIFKVNVALFFWAVFLVFSPTFSISQTIQSPRIIPVKDLNNILLTFGSCSSMFLDDPNDVFDRITETDSDVFVWLGDVTYIDFSKTGPELKFPGEEEARQKFIETKEDPKYKQLRESTPVIGVWDDHDYGVNNAGKDFPYKEIAQQLWLDFIDEPKDSLRRQREGIYESYYLGGVDKVKIILLDVRYFKDEPYFLSFGAQDLLGEEQWEWLENELKENQAEYVVIGSGTQIIPDDRVFPEKWFDQSKERLISLIRKYKTSGVILLTGDVHYAEIMKFPCKERVGFELYELTSSGMTHHLSTHVPYVSEVISELYPSTYNTIEDKYFERNFGTVKFHFGEKKNVELGISNYYGIPILKKIVDYADLVYNEGIINDEASCIIDTPNYMRFTSHYLKALLQGKKFVYLATFACIFAITFVIVLIRICIIVGIALYKKLGNRQTMLVNKTKQE